MQDEKLWEPSQDRMSRTAMDGFRRYLEAELGRELTTYRDLHRYSIENLEGFWGVASKFLQVQWRQQAEAVLRKSPTNGMRGTQWFPGGRLSWADNLLPAADDPSPKIISIIEGRQEPVIYSGAELYTSVVQATALLESLGVAPGDRVAAILPNTAEAVIGMLATAALGAVWSSASPDFGVAGIVDRFEQIQPKILLCTRSYSYNQKKFDCRETVKAVGDQLPSVEAVLMIDPLSEGGIPEAYLGWDKGLANFAGLERKPFLTRATEFEHPLYILFSSGTTGKPKCIVHSVGGTLLQHKKELMLHCDLGPGKRLLYFTTCGWMMWNWMVSALSVGTTLVLFEGSVTQEKGHILWRTVADHGVHCFGTSPKFLSATQKLGIVPRQEYDFSKLETVLSTGSPLVPEQFSWVYDCVKRDLHLASICGGTDIISCFLLGNPLSPVYPGEIQGPGLGMAVECWDEAGRPVIGSKGELVCTQAFLSMPLGFWGDSGEKYRQAYFTFFPGREVWRHGDFISQTKRGTFTVFGRSDATLNPGGVRIGTAEIYRQVESLPEVQDSLAVSREKQGDAEMVLFVKLLAQYRLDADLIDRIKRLLRQQLSPRHVPAEIIQVIDIPYTRSGKKLELAVTRILEGRDIDNLTAIANPECLVEYRALAAKN